MADRDDEYVRVDERVVIEVEQGRDPQDPATIRTDIHETRERMSHTIEELSERLNPDHLKAQVKENVREATIGRAEHMAQKAVSRVSETRHSMMDTLRDNPLPAALMGIGLGWMLWNGRKQEERFEGDVAYQTYGRYPQTGYRYGSGGYGTTGGYAGGYGATGAYGGSGGYRYEEDEPGVAERARDKAGDLRDRAGDVAESARDTVSDLADRTRDAAGDAAERARMAAESLARQTRYRTHRLEDRFQDTLYETPLVLGAAAAVLGMAVGLSAPATRREVELMGATRDQLFDRAKEAASEAGEKVQAVAGRVAEEVQSTAKEAAREQGLTGGGATGGGAAGSTGAGFGSGTGTGMGGGTGTGMGGGTGAGTATGGFGGTGTGGLGTGTGAGGMGTGTGTGAGGMGTGTGTGLGTSGTGTGTGTGGFGTGGAGSTGMGGGGFGAGGPGSTGTGGTGGTGTGSI